MPGTGKCRRMKQTDLNSGQLDEEHDAVKVKSVKQRQAGIYYCVHDN